MELFSRPELLLYLELGFILLSVAALTVAFLLMRVARRPLDLPRKVPHHRPSTPLTREKPRRARELTRV